MFVLETPEMFCSGLKVLDPALVRNQINTLQKVYTYDINTLVCDGSEQAYLRVSIR